MRYLSLFLLLAGCASPQTPYEKCNELAHRAGVYHYTYAVIEKDGSISCVVPLDYSKPDLPLYGRFSK